MWDEECNKHLFTRANLEAVQLLIDWMTDWDMEMALPKDIPTLEVSSSKNLTRPDNVFISRSIKNRVCICKAIPEQWAVHADHFPILTTLDVATEQAPQRETRNFKRVDWEKFRTTLKQKWLEWQWPTKPRDQDSFEDVRRRFTKALHDLIEAHAPSKPITTFARCWWTKDLSLLRNQVHKLARR
jgi:hypothetical protein